MANMGLAITDEYGEMHKMVLQGLMAAGFLDAKGVKGLFLGTCRALKMSDGEIAEKTSMMHVQRIVREVNEKIRTFDMAIRSASCELTGKKYYIFLVTAEKPIMKMQQVFSKFELELFKKIVSDALKKYKNFAIPYTTCINMASEIDARNFSKVTAEEFIENMINLLYLAKYFPDQKNHPNVYEVTLGVRAVRELESIFRESYEEILQNCYLCKMIMLHGHSCRKCNCHIHKACFTKYLQTCPTCPTCRCDWKDPNSMIRRTNPFLVSNDEKEHRDYSRRSHSSSVYPTRDIAGIASQSPPTPGTARGTRDSETESQTPTSGTTSQTHISGTANQSTLAKASGHKNSKSKKQSPTSPSKAQKESGSKSKTVSAEKHNEEMPVLEPMVPSTRGQAHRKTQRKSRTHTTTHASSSPEPRKKRVVRIPSSGSD